MKRARTDVDSLADAFDRRVQLKPSPVDEELVDAFASVTLLKPMPLDKPAVLAELQRAEDAVDISGIMRIFRIAHMDAELAAKACHAVGVTADYMFARRAIEFGALGACESVVDVLRAWGTICENATEACYAIQRLVSVCTANRARFIACGVCKCLVDALERWGRVNRDVAYHVCISIVFLIQEGPEIKAEFLRIGAANAVQCTMQVDYRNAALAALSKV